MAVLTRLTCLCFNAHHGGLHHRDALRGPIATLHQNLSRSDRNGLANPHSPSNSEERVTYSRGHEVDLELHAQHRRVGRHPGQTRIPAGAVGDGSDRTSMNKAVLLRDVRRRSKPNANFAVLHGGELGTERSHQLLAAKRLPDAVFDLFIVHDPLYIRGA